jgi:hypothetical protein
MIAGTLLLFLSACSESKNNHQAFTSKDSWYTACTELGGQSNEIPRHLIKVVPQKNLSEAIKSLESVSVLPLSLAEARLLVAEERLDPDLLLEEDAKQADAEAMRREKESKEPAFAGATAKKMKMWAQENRQKADETRSQKGKLKPYLVRALVLNEGTGAFSVYQNISSICVFHGSLGKSAVPMQRRPIVVFLPRQPKKVYVTVSMAE